MRSLLKLIVLLFCIQNGEGRGLRSLLEKRDETGSPGEESGAGQTREDNNHHQPQREGSGATQPWSELPRSVSVHPYVVRSRRSSSYHDSSCALHFLQLQVQDLGLGYDSDETVVFKYCSGSCPHTRSNHDLTLTNLLLRGALPSPPPGETWQTAPCCRPTHHEDVVFLDNSHRWHKVEKLSAAGCNCVG